MGLLSVPIWHGWFIATFCRLPRILGGYLDHTFDAKATCTNVNKQTRLFANVFHPAVGIRWFKEVRAENSETSWGICKDTQRCTTDPRECSIQSTCASSLTKRWSFPHAETSQDLQPTRQPFLSKRSDARWPTTMSVWKRGWDTQLIGITSRTPTPPWRQKIWAVWDMRVLADIGSPTKSRVTPTQRKAKRSNFTVHGMRLGISLPTSSVRCYRSTAPSWPCATRLAESWQMML